MIQAEKEQEGTNEHPYKKYGFHLDFPIHQLRENCVS